MTKQKPLEASTRSAWIKNERTVHRYEIPMIEFFLRGCPCPKVSARRVNIIPFSNASNDQCARILSDLNNIGVPLEPKNNPSSLAKSLMDQKRSGAGFPRGNQQFVLYTISRPSILHDYGLYRNRKGSEIKADESSKYHSLLQLDGFFRHLRNSIAHGSYAECTRFLTEQTTKRGRYWFFQDANTTGSITARYFVSEQTINSWIDTLRDWISE